MVVLKQNRMEILRSEDLQLIMELEVRKWIEESHKEKRTHSILFTFFFLPDLCFYFLLSEKLPVVYFLC